MKLKEGKWKELKWKEMKWKEGRKKMEEREEWNGRKGNEWTGMKEGNGRKEIKGR